MVCLLQEQVARTVLPDQYNGAWLPITGVSIGSNQCLFTFGGAAFAHEYRYLLC